MARQWQRIGSLAATVLLLMLVFTGFRYLREDAATPGLEMTGEGQHERKVPYRPQYEQQSADGAIIEGVASGTPTFSASSLEETQTAPLEAPVTTPPPDSPEDHHDVDEVSKIPKGSGFAKPPDINKLLAELETESAGPTTPSPAKPSLSKAIVMGKLSSEETDWVASELPDWQPFIYVVDLAPNETSPTGFRTPMNKAKEAMPYLTYITDHYPDFPDLMVFIHAHRAGYPQAWHTDARKNDAVNMLRDLRLDAVRERGYVNLRCIETPGCPDEIRPWRYPPDPEKVPEQLFPFVYAEFFNRSLPETRQEVEVVATPCCAQFAVSREQILKRGRGSMSGTGGIWRRRNIVMITSGGV
ncbi:hypothetical protein B0A55_03688 [Friedmanniomyces simplex]|uniref:Uncharacterized protein n=1 Tax=Friedmanniomyces simplex TaxID=329884 RepID=A0A4U0XSI9_9PEZI|nr:hypothetical protein B0A55_03688 [Friedmanniomyces simplex]